MTKPRTVEFISKIEYEIGAIPMRKETRLAVIEAIRTVRHLALEEAAKALDPLYVMKGSENDGMIYIPDAQKAIRALKFHAPGAEGERA